MSRRRRDRKITKFNSFIDIMTCLAGILILIILLVILQIQEVRVVIPTPTESESSKRPIFIECRSNRLYRIELEVIKEKVDGELRRLSQASQVGARLDHKRFLESLARAKLQHGAYILDVSYMLTGQFAMWPNPAVEGYLLANIGEEIRTGWFGQILSTMDAKREMLTFIVRDDSFPVFRRARSLAWINDVDAAWYLLPHDEPIKFGRNGEAPLTQ